jgi:hypothetical protein
MADKSQEKEMKRVSTRSSAAYMALRQESGAFRIERGETETSDPLFLGIAQEQDRAERLLDWWLDHDLDVEAATHLNGSSTKALMQLMVRAAQETVNPPAPPQRDAATLDLSDGRTVARRLPDTGFIELSNASGKTYLSPDDLADIKGLARPPQVFPIPPIVAE